MGEITTVKPCSSKPNRQPGCTCLISPTRPRSPIGCFRHSPRNRPPSTPLRPMALTPAITRWLTSLLFTSPDRTISATLSDSSSVTRNPSTKRGSIPRRFCRSAISVPPPCTTTTWPARVIGTNAPTRPSSAGPSLSSAPPTLTSVMLSIHPPFPGSLPRALPRGTLAALTQAALPITTNKNTSSRLESWWVRQSASISAQTEPTRPWVRLLPAAPPQS